MILGTTFDQTKFLDSTYSSDVLGTEKICGYQLMGAKRRGCNEEEELKYKQLAALQVEEIGTHLSFYADNRRTSEPQ
jgi:hypothetical protein